MGVAHGEGGVPRGSREYMGDRMTVAHDLHLPVQPGDGHRAVIVGKRASEPEIARGEHGDYQQDQPAEAGAEPPEPEAAAPALAPPGHERPSRMRARCSSKPGAGGRAGGSS